MDSASVYDRLSAATRAFIARPHRLLIDGKWVEPRSGRRLAVFDPASGQQIAAVAEGGTEDAKLAAAAVHRAFEDGPWGRLKPVERGKLVWKLGDVLEAHAEELGQVGSPRQRQADPRCARHRYSVPL